MSGTGPVLVVGSMPVAPRPADPRVRELADALYRIEVNYEREGTGYGSRFEGRMLEDVQAEYAARVVQGWVST